MNPDIKGFMRKVKKHDPKRRLRNYERYIQVIDLFHQYNILTVNDLKRNDIVRSNEVMGLFRDYGFIEISHNEIITNGIYPVSLNYWQIMDTSSIDDLRGELVTELNSLKAKI
jgi:hypothetical protein